MPHAITLRLAEADCAPVTALLDRLAAAGIADDLLQLGYAPHITLAVYPDDADASALAATAAALSVQWKMLRVRIAGLGIFANSPAVLYLAPVVTSALLVRHAQLLARHPAAGHSASGAWVPHVTLSAALAAPSGLAAAVATVSPVFAPFEAALDRIDLIRFAPVDVLFSGALAGG
jgi:2'-5' RNA ligase